MEHFNPNHERETFGSKLGVLAATAGSAIGLGNIWRFPYLTGEYGGAAFLLIYLMCILLLGVPILFSEFLLGRMSKKGVIGSYKKLGTQFLVKKMGWLGLISTVIVVIYYPVIAGWTLHYLGLSVMNKLNGVDVLGLQVMFDSFIANPIMPVFWQLVIMVITGAIVFLGLKNGIELANKIILPILFIIIIFIAMRALTLPGAYKGIEFLFKPDWTVITRRPEVFLEALGQAFFSLSVGSGVMITYGSYAKEQVNLGKMALQVASADTMSAIFAGIAIFPAAFAFSIRPDSGFGLVFITLPNVFSQMPGGYIIGILFFLLLALAAISTTIGEVNVIVAYLEEEWDLDRAEATIGTTAVGATIGILCALSYGVLDFRVFPMFNGGQFEWMNLLDFMDYATANFILPLAGLLSLLMVNWILKKSVVVEELSKAERPNILIFNSVRIISKFVAPVAILLVFVYNLGIIKL